MKKGGGTGLSLIHIWINIPWAILMDPTAACNLKCTGCWTAEYDQSDSLSYETLDRIIREGKQLGIYMYIYSGGEPLVRKHDLIRLAEKHDDCMFLSFTNATLVDEAFCKAVSYTHLDVYKRQRAPSGRKPLLSLPPPAGASSPGCRP